MSEGSIDKKIPGVGSALSAARERQGLSVADVARQLKLGVRQIEALEAEDYKNLPRMTFVRGFIRNYAKLLQIDAEPLLKAIEHLQASPQVPETEPGVGEIPTVSRKKNTWRSYAVFVVFAALGLVFLGLEWYREQATAHHQQVAAVKPTMGKMQVQSNTPRLTSSANSANPAGPAASANRTGSSNPLVNDKSTPPEPAHEAKPAVAQENRSAEIRLDFEQESWVEIADKNGKTIFSQLSPAGSTETVRGYPPLSLVVGNAAGVKLTYNDKPVDLQPYTKVDVARITLE